MNSESQTNLFKLVMIGPSGGGKTSLTRSIYESTFDKEYIPTIGVDFINKIFENHIDKYLIQIWDAAGSVKFESIISSYITISIAQIIVFDLTDLQSFQFIPYHLKRKDNTSPEKQKIYLFGNKSDLYENRQITFDQAEQFAKSEGIQYFETSAIDFEGINEIMANIINSLAQSQTVNAPKKEYNQIIAAPNQQFQQKQLNQAAPSNLEIRTIQKIVIIGDEKSGKSSFLSRITDNTFSDKYLKTIGVDYKAKQLNVSGKLVKLELWDTSGQVYYKILIESYFKGAYAFVLFYDITDRQQFNNLKDWFNRLQKEDCIGKPVFLIGNKTDLHLQRNVTIDEGKILADQFDWRFYETSCKDEDNQEYIIIDVASNIFQ